MTIASPFNTDIFHNTLPQPKTPLSEASSHKQKCSVGTEVEAFPWLSNRAISVFTSSTYVCRAGLTKALKAFCSSAGKNAK